MKKLAPVKKALKRSPECVGTSISLLRATLDDARTLAKADGRTVSGFISRLIGAEMKRRREAERRKRQ